MSRPINQATLNLIKSFEGLYLEAYKCPAGIWTIGYGHTGIRHNDGTVHKGRILADEHEAERLLAADLEYFSRGVEKLLLSRPREELNDNQFGALVSFAFNCGLGNLGGTPGRSPSTLLQRINARDYLGAIPEFAKWNKAGGKIYRGLTRRRLSETALFCSFPNPIVKA